VAAIGKRRTRLREPDACSIIDGRSDAGTVSLPGWPGIPAGMRHGASLPIRTRF
jgi:hypothetical protein